MPRIPRKSPATGEPVPDHYVHTTANHFVDNHGRVLILRGVNLSGSSKNPLNQPSHVLDGFWESVENGDGESFVGRPLGDLSDGGEADSHLARLRGWGFSILRYVFTWEAIEHKGPYVSNSLFTSFPCKGSLRRVVEPPCFVIRSTSSRVTNSSGVSNKAAYSANLTLSTVAYSF
jgi:hypothetical protein